MDFSKIRLNNERNAHVFKRRNRLGAWGFFKVLYRDNIWRLFGFSLLMLLMIAPIFAVNYMGQLATSKIYQTLPIHNILGLSTGAWLGMNEYYSQQVYSTTVAYGFLMASASLLVSVVFSGGFAVIRDAFWTGKLSTVGVFKSLGMGITANFGYAIGSVAIIGFGVYGIAMFYLWLSQTILWLAIILTVLLSLLMLLVACYLLILCSVSVTYKQSFAENLDDAWRLLWMNFLPNVLHLIVALLPVLFVFVPSSSSMILMFVMVLFLMFGGIYFPLVWHTHMMKTFALFHPVEVKKKKDVMRELRAREMAEAAAKEEAAKAAAARKESRKNKGKKTTETVTPATEEVVEDIVSDDDSEEK